MTKPYSQACDNNKAPILDVLTRVFDQTTQVLEIGSGTGQHAAYFSARLNHLCWQPSDRAENLAGIEQWCKHSDNKCLNPPVVFDVQTDDWPLAEVDAVFSANTAHIMPNETAIHMVRRVAEQLPTGGIFALYGPFNYGGKFTSESNANFDQWLKSNNPAQGIRDFESINEQALQAGLSLFEDNPMPANNRLLVWVKQSGLADTIELA